MPSQFFASLLALLLVFSAIAAVAEDGTRRAKHVVLIVWDGMRPDFVTERYTPNLSKLSQAGVTFRQHHSIFPSATNVNGTVMATGVRPARSGLIANMEFQPEMNPGAPVDTADAARIRQGDELSNGKYLNALTLPEMLHAAGKRSAIAGTKWIATLFDRSLHRTSDAATASYAVTAGNTSREPVAALLDSLGAFPLKQTPNSAQDEWTTRALTHSFWKAGVPEFSLLWLSDPDFAAHDTAPGSPDVLAAIKHSDAILGKVIAALEAKHVRDETDIFVVSDHGFSTVERAVDIPALLNAAGFNAGKKFESEPEAGTILVVGNGGTVLFYVIGRDETITSRLVEWLQQSDFAGVIFTRSKIEGTFSLDEVHLAKKGGPDVVMSFRWNESRNEFGTPGFIMSDWHRAAGKGTHATLSKFDLHNMLIAAGPHFRRGHKSDLPSSNIDLAPTILHLLGVAPPVQLDGRILSEAMTDGDTKNPAVRTERMEASRDFASGSWRQYLKVSRVGAHAYIDEGNGSSSTAMAR